MASESRGRGAGALNPRRVRPLKRQAVSGSSPPQPVRPFSRKGAAKQGGTTGAFHAPVLVAMQGRGHFLLHLPCGGFLYFMITMWVKQTV